MYSKKINQLATNLNPQSSDLLPIGDAETGQLKTITYASLSGGVVQGDGVINGGVVTWSGTGLIFNISACTYILNGIRYTSPASTKTLAASDPTNPRIDVFAVNTSGQVVIIQGTPNVNPVEPQVDVDTQLQLTNVTITAGSTTPTQVTTNMVYNENLPYGGEWVMELGQGTTPSYTIQADYTGYAPYNGTYSWRTTKAFAGSVSLRWAKDPVVNFNVSDYTNLSLAVRITNAITSTDSIKIWFESDTNSVSSNKLSLTTLYGFNPNLLNQWQLVVIPIADFKLLRTQFAKIVLYWNQTSVVSSAMGFDEMKLQGGISNNTNNPVIPPQTGNNGKYLTTNGSTLSWDNAMKIGGSITSATAGSVLFAGALGVLAQDNSNFFWDDSNNRLGIGTATPSNKLSIVETTNVAIGFNVTNTTTGTSNSLNMNLVADTTAGYVQFQKRSSTHTATGIANASSGLLYNSEGDLIIGTGGATSWIRFATNGITTADMNLTANGRLLLGTSTEGTTLLNVNGTSLFQDSVGIGSAVIAGRRVSNRLSLTGATTAMAYEYEGNVLSDVTSDARGFSSYIATSGTFTLSILRHFFASAPSTFSATITNQYGFFADAGLIGATNNYGFYGNIASGGNRWNLYMNGTANNYMAGSLGIGTTSLGTQNLRLTKQITGATAYYNFRNDSQIQADVTSFATYNYAISSTAVSTTINFVTLYEANQGTFGAGSTITNQVGFHAQTTLIGATNNYGFRGSIPSGTNRWNIYMDGTAINYLNGALLIGTTTDAGYKLDVNGSVKFGSTSGMIWDNTNARLGIGLSAPTCDIDVTRGSTGAVAIQIKNSSTGSSSQAVMNFIADTAANTAQFQKLSTSFASPVAPLLAGDFGITNYSSGDIGIINKFSTGKIKFSVNNTSVSQMTLTAAGGLLIGTTTENTSALLNVTSTTKGFLPPRMTTTQKNAIGTPAAGLVVYDTTTNKLCCYNGTTWNDLF